LPAAAIASCASCYGPGVRRLARLALLVVTFLLAASVAEGILRLAWPWAALPRFRAGGYLHSQLHHRYPPDARMHDRFGRERYVVETNEDGLRSGWPRRAVSPSYGRVYTTVAEVIEKRRDFPKAVEWARKAVKAAPEDCAPGRHDVRPPWEGRRRPCGPILPLLCGLSRETRGSWRW